MASASPRWYHPNLTRQETHSLLLQPSYPEGSYLVRPCEDHPGTYVLAVKFRESVCSVCIINSGDFFQLEQLSSAQAQAVADRDSSKAFPTLAELITHCIRSKELALPEDESGVVHSVSLRSAVPCLDLSSKRWYHGQLETADACQKLSEVEQQNVFLVRCRTADPGTFSIMVKGKYGIHHIAVLRDPVSGGYSCDGVRFSSSLIGLVESHAESGIRVACDNGEGEESVFLKKPYFYTAFVISDAIPHIENMLADRKGKALSAEFEHLADCENTATFSFSAGQCKENSEKNRYKNILPYDHSRVVLREQVNGATRPAGSNDYINASYISGREIGLTNTYIVTQGCCRSTVNDFWWMVWQENVSLVIMVTELVEAGKTKCAKYWPDAGSKVMCGSMQVHLVKETAKETYVVRQFQLSMKKSHILKGSPKERTLYQMHFKGWPDHGVPRESLSVLEFIEEVRTLCQKKTCGGPMVVHCSAGIGRSGVIVVLDMLLDLINRTDPSYEIDVQHVIRLARDQRRGMVQTFSQYNFIHRVLLEYLRRKSGSSENVKKHASQ